MFTAFVTIVTFRKLRSARPMAVVSRAGIKDHDLTLLTVRTAQAAMRSFFLAPKPFFSSSVGSSSAPSPSWQRSTMSPVDKPVLCRTSRSLRMVTCDV